MNNTYNKMYDTYSQGCGSGSGTGRIQIRVFRSKRQDFSENCNLIYSSDISGKFDKMSFMLYF